MKPRKRSLTIAGHRTSVSLEEPFWRAVADVAAARGLSPAALIAEIDGSRGDASLSSAIRIHLLEHYRSRSRCADVHAGGGPNTSTALSPPKAKEFDMT